MKIRMSTPCTVGVAGAERAVPQAELVAGPFRRKQLRGQVRVEDQVSKDLGDEHESRGQARGGVEYRAEATGLGGPTGKVPQGFREALRIERFFDEQPDPATTPGDEPEPAEAALRRGRAGADDGAAAGQLPTGPGERVREVTVVADADQLTPATLAVVGLAAADLRGTARVLSTRSAPPAAHRAAQGTAAARHIPCPRSELPHG